ncbi:hypothetical protein HUU40_00240 [candidate division KSB1 bacterium]|nr:hypothetical protein [candidate division KSB1 bacterium]
MFEICALLAPKKTAKVRKTPVKTVGPGKVATLTINGATVKILERDTKFKNAWYVEQDGERLPFSFSRDVLVIK